LRGRGCSNAACTCQTVAHLLPLLPPHPACPRLPPPPLSVIARTCVRSSPPAAGRQNDVYRFSAAANTWTALSPSGSGPSPRYSMGFASTPDGMLYVFGGISTGNGLVVVGGATPADGASCVAGDAVTRRARARPLLFLSFFLLEGTRVRREETSRCRCVCRGAAGNICTAPYRAFISMFWSRLLCVSPYRAGHHGPSACFH
jgi:hypothetical protein